jgi:hypothetical protein
MITYKMHLTVSQTPVLHPMTIFMPTISTMEILAVTIMNMPPTMILLPRIILQETAKIIHMYQLTIPMHHTKDMVAATTIQLITVVVAIQIITMVEVVEVQIIIMVGVQIITMAGVVGDQIITMEGVVVGVVHIITMEAMEAMVAMVAMVKLPIIMKHILKNVYASQQLLSLLVQQISLLLQLVIREMLQTPL